MRLCYAVKKSKAIKNFIQNTWLKYKKEVIRK